MYGPNFFQFQFLRATNNTSCWVLSTVCITWRGFPCRHPMNWNTGHIHPRTQTEPRSLRIRTTISYLLVLSTTQPAGMSWDIDGGTHCMGATQHCTCGTAYTYSCLCALAATQQCTRLHATQQPSHPYGWLITTTIQVQTLADDWLACKAGARSADLDTVV